MASVEHLPGATIRGRWGRLLSEEDAAEYLAISRTTLRTLEIIVRRIGKRVLYDIRELDRYVDRLADIPVLAGAGEGPSAEDVAAEEERFFERRRKRHGAH